jgi:hypothetical protein
MSTPASSDQTLQQAVDAVRKARGNVSDASRALGLSRSTLRDRLEMAAARGITPQVVVEVVPTPTPTPTLDKLSTDGLKERVRQLEADLKFQKAEVLDAEYVRSVILGMSEAEVEPPEWLARPTQAFTGPGVPTLFASDWHWGEVVDPRQIGGVNEYSVAIAQARARTLIEKTINLLKKHLVMPEYPGIVFALGGDMVSGDIHEELSATNEMEIMPVVLDLFGVLAWCIETLADEFGRVFVPCVSGNHGRNTHKIRAKGRNFTSFDWLLYQFLAKRFEGDERIRFQIPDGSDCHYTVMGHRYLLTHGDQFRSSGDSMIGALGPLIRGDHKKRSRNTQIDMGYDTMLCGHWHQLIQLQRLIVNGSIKGYCEYAYQSNFSFEVPRQAMWITHPEHGITFSAPVNVEEARHKPKTTSEWVGWKVVA